MSDARYDNTRSDMTRVDLHTQRMIHVPGHVPPSRPRSFEFYIAILALLPLLVVIHRIWAVQAILILLLLSVPGLLLLQAIRIPGRVVADFPALVPCASIIVLLATGLVLDLVGLLVGLSSPLRTWPILISIEAVCVGLVLIARGAGPNVELPGLTLGNPRALALPLILPLMAILGAQRLNNNDSNLVALVATLLCAAVLFITMFYAARLEKSLLTMILFSAALALLYSYSLRGALVYGFDISTEYQRLSETVTAGVWHPAHFRDAYGAMLSLTVMPTELHFLSGVSALMVFKAVYPLIGALFPIEVYAVARRMLSPTWSFMAAAIVILQSGFAEGLPALARQEVALALFGALVAVVLYRPPRKANQVGLIVLVALAMVVSHYSTTYVTITLFGAAIALQWVISWFRRIPRFTDVVVIGFAASLIGAVIWYGPVTQSASGLGAFLHDVSSQGLNLLPNQKAGENPILAYLSSGGEQTMPARQYEDAVHAKYVLEGLPIIPLNDAGEAKYNLKDDAAPVPPIRLASAHQAVSITGFLFQQVLNILGVIGAALLAFGRKVRRMDRLIGVLGLGAALFLIVMRLSGTFALAYNTQRAVIQSTDVFAITFCWPLQKIAGRWRNKRNTVFLVTSVLLAAYTANTTGILGAVLGGGTATNLANSGEDYERFSKSAQEIAAATWLGSEVRPGELVYADRYANLSVAAVTNLGKLTNPNVTPLTINRKSWVYAGTANIVDGRARAYYNNDFVRYAFPIQFLDDNFNIVYSDGASEVFHR